jgi:hypothetical protein
MSRSDLTEIYLRFHVVFPGPSPAAPHGMHARRLRHDRHPAGLPRGGAAACPPGSWWRGATRQIIGTDGTDIQLRRKPVYDRALVPDGTGVAKIGCGLLGGCPRSVPPRVTATLTAVVATTADIGCSLDFHSARRMERRLVCDAN